MDRITQDSVKKLWNFTLPFLLKKNEKVKQISNPKPEKPLINPRINNGSDNL